MSAKQPNRKRIVINLDQPGSSVGAVPGGGQSYGRKRTRRWPKVVAILVVLIFVGVIGLAVGGFFWWRHYQTTPAYSLALIVDAAQHDDMVAFEKQVDDDAVARNLVSEVSKKASDRYGIALNAPLQTQIDSMIPNLIPRLKDTIHQEVAKEIKDIAVKSEPRPFIIVAIAVQKLVTVNTEGDNARATAQMPNRTIELSLQRNGDRWKVTELKDDVLVQRVVDAVMKDLPAIGGIDLSPFLKPTRKPGRR
jgi:hypothetical protein